MIGERPIKLTEDDIEFKRQPGENCWRSKTAHSIGRIGDDSERTQHRRIDKRVHVGHKDTERIVTRRHGASDIDRLEAGNGHVTNFRQASFGSDWLCSCETQLHTVVLRRVMRGGQHGPRHIEMTSGEEEKIR